MGIFITQLAPGFERWDELLSLIMRSFASMDGVIDPPSSAHLLSVQSLRDKAGRETVLLALRAGRIAGCVFAGAYIPNHDLTSAPDNPASSRVGTSGMSDERCGDETA